MHGFVDVILLFQVEILLLRIVLTWRNISVFHSSERRCARCRILVPDAQILGLLLRLLALLLFSLPGHEDFFVVRGTERRLILLELAVSAHEAIFARAGRFKINHLFQLLYLIIPIS